MRTAFTGLGTALVTPFRSDGSIDEPAVRRLARRQVEAGVHFVSPCGTTGEAPTLSHREKLRVVELVMDEVAGRVPVLPGAGGYDTREVIELTRELETMGADGILSVTPYKQADPGRVVRHYRAIAGIPDCRSSYTTFPAAPVSTWTSGRSPVFPRSAISSA